jgi:glycosyltransferase involved in cell wall biosynthesis
VTTSIAVIIPCHDEEATVAKVIADFRSALPTADIFVIDNHSSDATAAVARSSGAVVVQEWQQGKGHAMRRAFADIDADIYVMVDGDDTYEASAAPGMIELLLRDGLDYVNGGRRYANPERQRRGHLLGNRMLSRSVAALFGRQVTDILSGYKILTRRFVKSFPVTSTGFEIETELAVHALQLRVPTAEFPVDYRDRPEDSHSKLRTFRDGWRILGTIARLAERERPLAVLAAFATLLALISLGLGIPVVLEFRATGLVDRFPTAILAIGLMTMALLALAAGLILDAVQHSRHETKRLAYLAVAAPRMRAAPTPASGESSTR